jgi:hypothetical protein
MLQVCCGIYYMLLASYHELVGIFDLICYNSAECWKTCFGHLWLLQRSRWAIHVSIFSFDCLMKSTCANSTQFLVQWSAVVTHI